MQLVIESMRYDGGGDHSQYTDDIGLSASSSWPLDFAWTTPPSLVSDPDYFANESMLCVDDFDYPSWQEFDCKLKEVEQLEQRQRPTTTMEEKAPDSKTSDDFDNQIDGIQCSTPPLCSLSPALSALETPNSVSSSRRSSLVSKAKLKTAKFEGVDITPQTLLHAFRTEILPFTLKRTTYMDWIKPSLIANPPVLDDTVDASRSFSYISDMLSASEEAFLRSLRFDMMARSEHFDFETFLTSVANKALLFHFCFSGVYNLNRESRKYLLDALKELIFGTVILDSQVPYIAMMSRLLNHRIKYFRDVMSRQYKSLLSRRPRL